ncbi:hypothetical protein [Brevundimonas sp.]|jgi:hypothetical protein|uniref:hypothetical protein n=1 Tax=Brevundimonas sp. TaxID=1871086 RepID=UPI00391C6ED1
MVKAVLFIYGLGHQINHGEWTFQQLPAPGDLVHIVGKDGQHHYASVRHVEHSPVRLEGQGQPAAIIVTDWSSTHPADLLS